MTIKEMYNKECLELLNQTTHEILKNPQQGFPILERLRNEPRYRDNEPCQLVIQSLFALMHTLKSKLSYSKQLVKENIVEARRLGIPGLVSFNYNTLGNIFFGYSLYSQAIEAYLLAVKLEEQEEINVVQGPSLINIALVFDILGDTTSSIKYLKKAYRRLAPKELRTNHEYSKYIYVICNLLVNLSKTKNTTEAEVLLKEIESVDKSIIDKKALSNIEEALMHYHVHTGNYEEGNHHFKQAKLIILEFFGAGALTRLVKDYAELFYYNDVDFEHYIGFIEDYVRESAEIHSSFLAKLYFILNKYYKSLEDRDKIDMSYEKYMYYSEKALEEAKADYLNAVDRINENIFFMEENALIKKQNKKLKLLTEELEMANKTMEITKNRLNVVTAIGQKVVSSLNLETILSMINKSINKLMPLTSFTVFTLNEDETALESKAIFNKSVKHDSISLSLQAKESFNVLAFLKGETIIINNSEDFYKHFDREDLNKETCEVKSAMFIPIRLEKRVVAVISLQSDEDGAFSKEYQQFFESLSPFLAIAINNAKHSEKLQSEIESHKLTQQKLQAVNKELKRLSTLDSLTQIYNRRQFDSMYTKFLKKAEKEGLPLSVCLFDIDNFKNYNDSYGHLEGDRVLVQVANIIKDHFDHKTSIVARFGGEEFIAVQLGQNEAEILSNLNEVRSKIKSLAIENVESSHGYITISIGVSSNISPKLADKSSMMRQADECLYKAKSKGKDQVFQALF